MNTLRIAGIVAAASIALGSLGMGPTFAAGMIHKKPTHHHALACKPGSTLQKVKHHGKWIWVCQHVHAHPGAKHKTK